MDFLVIGQNKKLIDYPSHSHEIWELLINIEGSGTAVIDGQTYDFCPGTIFCIRPGVAHSKHSDEGFVDGSVLMTDFCFEDEPDNVMVFQDDDRGSFYGLYRIAYHYPANPDTDIYAQRFLRDIKNAMQNLLCHWKRMTYRSPEIFKMQQVLADHLKDFRVDINQLILDHTSYSPNHFRKIFKEQCGCSPLRYYNQMKIQMAKQQIIQNKSYLTLNEISRSCGFDDPYYFSRVFKKIAGVSPMQFYKESIAPIPTPVPNEDLIE